MGRLSNEPIIQHFSHPHPLQLSSLDQLQQQSLAPPILSCANCGLPARGGYAYACSPCSYVLHVQCSEMPPLIHHASHRAHPLSLLPVPAYPEGSFDCDACARPGTGFSYHCRACGVDLHTLCASMPLSVVPDASLHPHPLALAFAPPYENKAFSCDVCGGLGSSQWLYRCAPCEFDAHLECAGRRQQQQQAVGRSGSVVVQGTPRAAAVGRSGSGGMPGLARAGSGAGGMVRQMVQGLLSTTTQNIGSRFVPGYVGDGGAAVANGGGRGGPGGAWNNGPPSQGGRGVGRGRGGGYNGWNGNGGGGRSGGGGPPGAWNGYGGGGGGGRGQGSGPGGPGAGNDPNGAQAASYDYGGNGDGSGDSNYGYVDSGGGGGGNGDGVDYGSVADAVAGVDYGSVVDAVAGVGSAVLNAFGGGSEDN